MFGTALNLRAVVDGLLSNRQKSGYGNSQRLSVLRILNGEVELERTCGCSRVPADSLLRSAQEER